MFNAPLLPCALPDAPEIPGRTITLQRLDPGRHGGDLWRAIGSSDELWHNVPPGPFTDEAAFISWLAERAQKPGQELYALVDPNDTAQGLYLLINIDQSVGRIELGLMLGSGMARSTAATEAFLLIGRHVFQELRYRRMEWRCSPENKASMRAAERLGFTLEGVLRQNTWLKKRNWDTAVFSIIDSEWPARAARLSKWLSSDNFDSDGRQKTKLSELAAN